MRTLLVLIGWSVLFTILAIVAGVAILATFRRNKGTRVTINWWPHRTLRLVIAVAFTVAAALTWAKGIVPAYDNYKVAKAEQPAPSSDDADSDQPKDDTNSDPADDSADESAEAQTGSPVDLSFQSGEEEVDQTELEEGHLDAINFSEINLEALYGIYHDDYISWESMPLTKRWREAASGYDDAVGFPFTLDPRWVEEQIGFNREGESDSQLDNNIAKLQLNKTQKSRLLSALAKEIKAKGKEYDAMTDEEKDVFVHERVNKLLHNDLLMLDEFYQFLASDEYFMCNNAAWITEGKKTLDAIFENKDGISSVMRYAEDHDQDPAYLQYKDLINQLADQACYIMDGAKYRGVIKANSERNWHFDHTMKVDDNHIRLVESKDQEKAKMWFAFDFISKAGGIQKRIGFNKKDTRLGVLTLEKPKAKEKKNPPREDKDKPDEEPARVQYIITCLEKGTKKTVHDPIVDYVKVGGSVIVEAPSARGYKKLAPTSYTISAGKDTKSPIRKTFWYERKGEKTPPPAKTTKYNLSVLRRYSNGEVIERKPLGRKAAGEKYTYEAPSIQGYTANPPSESGYMPSKDYTIVITYKPKGSSTPPSSNPPSRTDPPKDGEGAKNDNNSSNHDKTVDKGSGTNNDKGTGTEGNHAAADSGYTSYIPSKQEQQQQQTEQKTQQENQQKTDTSGKPADQVQGGDSPGYGNITDNMQDVTSTKTETTTNPDGSTTTTTTTTDVSKEENNVAVSDD